MKLRYFCSPLVVKRLSDMLDHILILDDTWRKCDITTLLLFFGCVARTAVSTTSSTGIFAAKELIHKLGW